MESFRFWLESQLQNLPISILVMTKSELAAAVSNIVRGHPAITEGPLEVAFHKDSNSYQLVNGYHRIVSTMLSGNKSVNVKQTSVASWPLPSEDDLFEYQEELPYKGLEEFIESYILRKL